MAEKIKKFFRRETDVATSQSIPMEEEPAASSESSCGFDLATEDDRTCPYCGGRKDRLELLCYYHEGNFVWSDNRHLLPNQAVPSLVQQCPHCGKYYISQAGGVFIKNTADFEWIDPVTWDYFKKSYWDFCELAKDEIVEFNHRLRIWCAYNDEFSRSQYASQPSEEDFRIFKDNALHLIEMQDPTTQAELYREIGMFDECLALLAGTLPESEGHKGYMDIIADYANKKNTQPFGWEVNEQD